MILGIQGTRKFDDYQVFLRAMGTALSSLEVEDKEFLIYSAGPAQINSMALEFSNISERTLKSRGIKIKTIKVSPRWLKDNMHTTSYFMFFSKPKEALSDLVKQADDKEIEVGVYRY